MRNKIEYSSHTFNTGARGSASWRSVENVIDSVVGFIEKGIDAVKRFFSALNNGKAGDSSSGTPRSTSPSPRARMTAPTNVTDGNGEGAASLTASTFSRAATVRALESAIPNVERRVSVATAAMAPAAGYSVPPPVPAGGGGNGGGQQAPIILRPNWTLQFQGDLAQVGRVLNPVIKDEDHRLGHGV